MPRVTQSVAFDRSASPATVNGGAGWTRDDSRKWMTANGFSRDVTSASLTENRLRFRLVHPDRCKPDSFRTERTGLITRGVQLITAELFES